MLFVVVLVALSGAVAGGGERHTSAQAVSVVALGDSVPSGYGCDCPGYVQSFADQVAAATGRRSEVVNFADGGLTSGDVAESLTDQRVQEQVARSDVVLIQVGANDIDSDALSDPSCQPVETSSCWDAALGTLSLNLIDIVSATASTSHRSVLLVGYWNVTVAGAVAQDEGEPFVQASVAITDAVNGVIAQVAEETGSTYVDARTPFVGADGLGDPTPYLQDDGDHPDADGHQLLADAAFAAWRDSGALDRLRSPGRR